MSGQLCECGRPTAGAWLCPDCQTTFAYAIANVSAHYADLENVETKRARYGTNGATKGSIGKAQPLPVDARFADILGGGTQTKWDAWNTVVAWCRVVMEELPELDGNPCATACLHTNCAEMRRRQWPANTVTSMCLYLARHFRWIVRQEWSAAMMDELLDVERRLVRLVNRPPDRWYAGKCSATDESGNVCERELYAQAEKGAITCDACGTEHDVATRRDYLLNEAKEILVTATEAARALLAWTDYDGTEKKLVDRIRKWRDRERDPLEVREVTSLLGRDRHLYRLGDIQALLVAAAQSRTLRAG